MKGVCCEGKERILSMKMLSREVKAVEYAWINRVAQLSPRCKLALRGRAFNPQGARALPRQPEQQVEMHGQQAHEGGEVHVEGEKARSEGQLVRKCERMKGTSGDVRMRGGEEEKG